MKALALVATLLLASVAYAEPRSLVMPPASQPSEAEQLRVELTKLKAENAKLKAELATLKAKATATQAATQPSDEIAKAMKEHRIVAGMTVEQAAKSVQGRPSLTAESDGVQYYKFEVYRDREVPTALGKPRLENYLAATYSAEVRDGKVIRWSRD